MNRIIKQKEVTITGGLLADKRQLAASVTVPYIRKAIYDELSEVCQSGAAENFKIAAGESDSKFHGLVSQDSDMFKWMEAASLALSVWYDEEEKQRLNEAIGLVGRAQQKDGYLNTYYTINGLKYKWSYLKESCQLYCAGHLLEAAVSNYEVTGERELLEIAGNYADCIDRAFGAEDGKIQGYDGHAEIELALYRLYAATGEERYKKLAGFFIEERGKQPYFFSMEEKFHGVNENLVYALAEEDYHHSQSHLPIREQMEVRGHAVKAMYFYTAAADKARLEQDVQLKEVLEQLWEDVTERKMYLTGAIGSSEYGESFTYAYDLPGDLMYGETCASIGLFYWGFHMLLNDNNRRYSDIMERVLYNGILCGISEKGTEFFYTNPLEIDPVRCQNRKDYSHLQTKRQNWFDCPCCPPNIARLLLSLDRYLYTVSETELNIHLFSESRLEAEGWRLTVETDYPQTGNVNMKIYGYDKKEGIVRIRIPGWCENFKLHIYGKEEPVKMEKGYIILKNNWNKEKIISIFMEMPAVYIYANQKVKSLAGKAAVMRGPIVYCAEEIDNGRLSSLYLKAEGMLREERDEIISVEGYREEACTTELYSKTTPKLIPARIKLLPYRLWNNRGSGEMKVFFPILK